MKRENSGLGRHIHKLVMAALFAALVAVTTMVIQIPSPTNGYVNIGDAFVLLSGWILGPLWGAAAAGIGTMLCELISAYAAYALPGLLIKGGMGAIAAGLAYVIHRKLPLPAACLLSGLVAEIWMIAGYFLNASLILGRGWSAALSIPGNVVQGGVGILLSTLLYLLLLKEKTLRERIQEMNRL